MDPGAKVISIVLLIVSLGVLLLAARFFVEGVSGTAAALGVSQLVIGMTVVAFGTSAPELVVNTVSAWRGSTGLAFGNVVGSCIVNVGFVLALTAMVRPLKVEPSLITREIPMLIVAAAAVVVLANDRFLDAVALDQWMRSDGFILLLLFSIFLYYTTRQAIATRRTDAFMAAVDAKVERKLSNPLWQELLRMSVGLAGLVVAAGSTVENAVSIARSLRVSEATIGITIVSLGTTLPELATCIFAARRGNADIAVGNIVGSNIFNLLCIGGIVSVVRPVPIPEGGRLDLVVMALLSVILLPVAIRSQRTITRGEGAFLFSTFLVYIIWRVATATGR